MVSVLPPCSSDLIMHTSSSSSLSLSSGHKLVRLGTGQAKMISCTRWSELSSDVTFLAELANAVGAPTEVRLLNNADPVMVGRPGDKDAGSLRKITSVSE
jgi:hypothetical protein